MSDEKRPLDKSGYPRQSPPIPPRTSHQLHPPLSPSDSVRNVPPPAYSPLPSIDSAPVGPMVQPDVYGRVSIEGEERRPGSRSSRRTAEDGSGSSGPGDFPPPTYTEGLLDITEDGMETRARIADDGRIDISINQKGRLGNLLTRSQLSLAQRAMEMQAKESSAPPPKPTLEVPEFAKKLPKLNILIQIIGSRGDVQPFVALGIVLKQEYGHRVRVATHPTFKGFVEENGLEFFSLGGDPSELMAFMVKNPGLMPGLDSLNNGEVSKRRQGMWGMLLGGWRACVESGDGMSYAPIPSVGANKPFVAEAIIANPPSFGHIHCAEKLGVPLHLMFTMPWSTTTAFPHPLANIQSSNAENGVTNFLSYALVDMLTWQGLGDLVNRFREKTLGLEPVSTMWAPGMIARLKVPHTYCWSPALIPKPLDWPKQISISGFYFLSLASSYRPPRELVDFLAAGPMPVYIGFGSIVVDDPNALTEMIFEAIRISGVRALVSQGWGGLGGEALNVPHGVMMLGNCPHDWLFPQCAAVVHHGGAGTTAAGVRCGKPTVVVPFFGDQPFWGSMVARAGAGPEPIPYKNLTAEALAQNIRAALEPEALVRAKDLGEKIRHEQGTAEGAKIFLAGLSKEPGAGGVGRCILYEDKVAVWRIRKTDIILSALAAYILVQRGEIIGGWEGLRLYHHMDWNTEQGPFEPISGATSALLGTVSSIMMGVGDLPHEIFRGFKKPSEEKGTSEQNSLYLKNSGSNSRASSSASLADTQNPKETSQAAVAQASSSTAPTRVASERRATKESSSTPGAGRGMNLDVALEAGKNVGRIVGAGLKSPMDFTLSLAQGFHNAPKLYGDDTVRPVEKITGLQSGLKTAGKEFGYGLYDGISGLVTQPIKGAKEEGTTGFLKGVGKGIGGVFFKGGAAVWGLSGYTMKGIHQEFKKMQKSESHKQIMDSRIAQGEQEFRNSTHAERNAIWSRWCAIVKDRDPQPRKRDSISSKWRSKRQPSSPSGVEGSTKSPFTRTRRSVEITSPISPSTSSPGAYSSPASSSPSSTKMFQNFTEYGDDEFERAIQQSVLKTSQGDPQEDAMIERAIRASVAEIRNSNQKPNTGDEEELLQRAINASIDEAGRYGTHTPGLEKSLLSSFQSGSVAGAPNTSPYGDAYTHEDEEFQRALRESRQVPRTPALPPTYEDEELERALMESRREAKSPETKGRGTDDVELRRALEESRRAEEELETKKRLEEEAVLQYVKKASLEEREYMKMLEEQKEVERAMRASMNSRQWGEGSGSRWGGR
ncbi:hypothetical protein RUND412_003602 [Rhizina undulata]